MSVSRNVGALLTPAGIRSGGLRVRLRLARRGDERPLVDLLLRIGVEAHELEVGRLVRFDPRRRVVICATALIGGREVVVGVGAIDFGAGTPDTLIVDRALAPGVDVLLIDALMGRLAASRAA
jgi:hypothetical protein